MPTPETYAILAAPTILFSHAIVYSHIFVASPIRATPYPAYGIGKKCMYIYENRPDGRLITNEFSPKNEKERLLGILKVGEFHLMRELLLGNEILGEFPLRTYY